MVAILTCSSSDLAEENLSRHQTIFGDGNIGTKTQANSMQKHIVWYFVNSSSNVHFFIVPYKNSICIQF